MNNPMEPVDGQVGSAVRELQDDLLGLHIPEFVPSPRRAPTIAAIVVLTVVGLGAYFVGTNEPGQVVETPPVDSLPDVSAPEGRNTDGQSGLSWGPDATPPVTGWTKPALFTRYPDPAYRTSIRRMTTAASARLDRSSSSRRQAENADGSLFLSYYDDGVYHVYDRKTGDLLRALEIHADAEPQWHPTDPNRIRHILGPNSYVGDLRLYEVDVTSGQNTIVADLTGRIQMAIPEALYMYDKAAGSPSSDGNRYAWIILNEAEEAIGIVSYDLAEDQILGIRTTFDAGHGAVRWVSASPSEGFVVAGFDHATVVWDADLGNERLLNQRDSSGDLVVQANGNDAWVYVDVDDGTSADAGWLLSVDISSLERTRLFQFYGGANTSIQVSGKGYDKPGWVIASTYNCSDPGAWTCDKIMAIEVGGDHRILNLAHTYNCGDNIWTEPEAVVNRSFTRVYFNSDGGSCGVDAEIYELEVSEFD